MLSLILISLDDTMIRKRGTKIAGTGWKRDPLGPAWQNSFSWGQRYLQKDYLLCRWRFHIQQNKSGFVQNSPQAQTHFFSMYSANSAICSASNG